MKVRQFIAVLKIFVANSRRFRFYIVFGQISEPWLLDTRETINKDVGFLASTR